MQSEVEYLRDQLQEMKELRNRLPGKFTEAQTQVETHIEQLMEKAGILGEVKRVKDELEKVRAQLQRQADVLSGKIEVMEHLFDTFHRDPVVPGTILHGIDISRLDWQTRLMVRNGNLQTIAALGGKFEATPSPVEDPGEDVPKSEPEVGAAVEPAAEYTLSDLQGLIR